MLFIGILPSSALRRGLPIFCRCKSRIFNCECYILGAMKNRLHHYGQLIRWDKPIGTLLLLWPTLMGLWLASGGRPAWSLLGIFTAGVWLMRSAGCIINDIADRHVDGFVQRTATRPLVTGAVSVKSALILFACLSALAFILVLQLNRFTILLSFVGLALALVYPLLKRITHLPQVGLGLAFSFSIPMAFAAVQNHIDWAAWSFFATMLLWPIIYDTEYAMVDRADDIQVGIKSTAILFGKADTLILAGLEVVFLSALVGIGYLFQLSAPYYLSLVMIAMVFIYQAQLIKRREREKCFQAFRLHNWVGFILLFGIILSLPL